MVPEAGLARGDHGLVPEGEGWFVLNTREARWEHSDAFGSWCRFEGDVRFPQLGINVSTLAPGQPSCMYHGENSQEDFLVLSGECILVVEGQERRLGRWDFVHCPAWTEHVFVGAGPGSCVLLAVGARPEDDRVKYPVNEVAQRYGAGVTQETSSADEAYAPFPAPREAAYPSGLLPGSL